MKTVAAALIAVLLMAMPALARGQDRGDQPAAVTPMELQRLFDSYALVQAQQFLGIPDDQYTKFLPRFMALHSGAAGPRTSSSGCSPSAA